MGYSSGTHFLSQNKDFDNGNSLRMTEQEDISPCYITKRGNLEPLNKLFRSRFTVFTGLRCYTTWRIMPQKIIVQLNLSLVTAKTCSSFLNYVNSTSLDITLTVSSSEKKKRRVVLLMESVQISPCDFSLRTQGKQMLSNFGFEIQWDLY